MKKYRIVYASAFDPKSLRSIAKADLRRIKKAIEKKLTDAPDVFGKPLRRSLKKFWTLRVQDYRVIYQIQKREVVVYAIRHRSDAYEWFLEKIQEG